jgi:hypothetical protein
MHKLAAPIYLKLSELMKTHVFEKVDRLLGLNSEAFLFLNSIDEVWRDHCAHIGTIRNIFLYLDR